MDRNAPHASPSCSWASYAIPVARGRHRLHSIPAIPACKQRIVWPITHLCPGLITPLDFRVWSVFGYGRRDRRTRPRPPDRPVVADHGRWRRFGYTMIEIQTSAFHTRLADHHAVVLGQRVHGALRKPISKEFLRRTSCWVRKSTSPRFDKFAELCGGKGIWVDGRNTGRAWAPALARGISHQRAKLLSSKSRSTPAR